MQQTGLKAEVLVPRSFRWWTFLALATDSSDCFQEVKFVSHPSGLADVVVVDVSLLQHLTSAMSRKPRLIVLLWDGSQSYWEHKREIEAVSLCASQIELRMVGDPGDMTQRPPSYYSCRRLFAQQPSLYTRGILSSANTSTISFSSRPDEMLLRHRPELISAKVFAQISAAGRWGEYKRTRFVYCGQSGIYTLKAHSQLCGVDPSARVYRTSGMRCEQAFLLQWTKAVLRIGDSPGRRAVTRALLRLIALRTLHRSRSCDIFMNIFPRKNMNAYQAGLLFRHHTFLEFGGIHGDEPVYPRTADIAFLGRRMLRFDPSLAIQRLYELASTNEAAPAGFIEWYEDQVITTFDRYSANELLEMLKRQTEGVPSLSL